MLKFCNILCDGLNLVLSFSGNCLSLTLNKDDNISREDNISKEDEPSQQLSKYIFCLKISLPINPSLRPLK